MRSELDTVAPASLLLGWLLASASACFAIVSAAIGQGVGGWTGGCSFIGLSLPVHRQPWGLVNQPLSAFSADLAASGYWLGSLLLPMVVAVVGLVLFPKLRTLHAELLAVHSAWAVAVVALAWVPLLDPQDSHLVRWLHFRELPPGLLWLAPAAAAAVAALATLRLLAVSRIARPHGGRGGRLAVVALHLVAPAAAFVGIASWVGAELRALPAAATAIPVAVAVAVAWYGYPPHPVRRPRPVSGADLLRTGALAGLLAASLWAAGRPLADGRCAGVLWGRALATNNIRPWIDARPLLGGPSLALRPEARD